MRRSAPVPDTDRADQVPPLRSPTRSTRCAPIGPGTPAPSAPFWACIRGRSAPLISERGDKAWTAPLARGTGHDKPTATIDRANICRALADELAGDPHSDAAFQLDATGRLTISPHPRSILDIQPDANNRYHPSDLDRIRTEGQDQ